MKHLRVCVAAIFITIILPFYSFPRVLEIIHYWQNKLPQANYDIQDIINIIRRVSSFKLFVLRNNCLKRSLLYYFFLKNTDLNGLEIVIGINKSNGKLSGHSWLILDNQPYLEDSNPNVEFHIIYSSGVKNNE